MISILLLLDVIILHINTLYLDQKLFKLLYIECIIYYLIDINAAQ